jgi:hypothetical protein
MTFEEYIRICRFCLFAVMRDQKTPDDVLNVPGDPLDDVAAAAEDPEGVTGSWQSLAEVDSWGEAEVSRPRVLSSHRRSWLPANPSRWR